MAKTEFDSWARFYADYPFDDRHRYHRPAALIAKMHTKADMSELLEFLQPSKARKDLASSDLNTLKAFGLNTPARK